MSQQEIDPAEATKDLLLELARVQHENALLKKLLLDALEVTKLMRGQTDRLLLIEAVKNYRRPRSKGGRPRSQIKDGDWQKLVTVAYDNEETYGRRATSQKAAIKRVVNFLAKESGKSWGETHRKKKVKTLENIVARNKKSQKP